MLGKCYKGTICTAVSETAPGTPPGSGPRAPGKWYLGGKSKGSLVGAGLWGQGTLCAVALWLKCDVVPKLKDIRCD